MGRSPTSQELTAELHEDRPTTTPWQLPGEFVLDQGGSVRLAYHYNYCESYPDPQVLTAAIKLAQTATPPQ